MNCFIHPHKAAVATCKRCGKAMCENCSAYSGHSGICPECRNDEYKRERAALIDERKSKIRWIVFEAGNAKRLKAIKERLTFVEGEIAKLDAALGRGVAET